MLRKFILIVFFLFFIDTPLAFCSNKNDENLFSQGVNYLKENDFKKAENSFKKVIKTNFGHYPSYFNLSLLYLIKKDFKTGVTVLGDTKKFNPYDIRIDQMFSLSFLKLDNLEEAKKYISAILLKKADDINSHKKLGIIYVEEKNFKEAASEFALVKNLNPADPQNTLLLSMAYALEDNFSQSLEKLTEIKDNLKDDQELTFYALILEKNNLNKEAREIYKKIQSKPNEKTISQLTFYLKEKILLSELNNLSPIEEFQIPEVSKRIIEQLERETILTPSTEQSKTAKKKPFNLKGKLTETFEIYKRKPAATSPINGAQTTTNLNMEGKTKNNINFSSEWEWFYNRWDHTVLDYYEVNLNKRDNYEVDMGKFSPKHFPTLVSYPTVIDGGRFWKKFTLPAAVPQKIEIPGSSTEPINLGELYRNAFMEKQLFQTTEITFLTGRTLDPISLDERKQKNENTYETSGQFEQWTHGYRLYSQVTSYMNMGTSLTLTSDRSESIRAGSSTYPIRSKAIGLDGGFKFLDKKLTFDWETAFSDFNSNVTDKTTKHKRDNAWMFNSKYTPVNESTFSYEQKTIKKNFEVEGAYQTADKISHTISYQYNPSNPKTWDIKSLTLQFKPEETNFLGGGSTKQRYRTFQPVISFKLPQDAKLTSDYKYYREYDKCDCTNYRTRTLKTDLDWEIPGLKTTVKPAYTFERKDDRIVLATDEKAKTYSFSIENTSIKNLSLELSAEEERKQYIGATTKSYREKDYSFETKYSFIPSINEVTFKISRDKKHPTDTNKTELVTLSLSWDLNSKDGNDKLNLKYERKNNIYEPWSDTSAYRQNYVKVKYTHKF